jgi:hypothetical protein
MTRDDIIRMAREAEIDCDADGDIWGSTNGSLIRFAELVRQHTQIEQMPKFEELANILREKQEPVAWMTPSKQNIVAADDVGASVPNWTDYYTIPLYILPPPCPTCEALARTVMMDQMGRDA